VSVPSRIRRNVGAFLAVSALALAVAQDQFAFMPASGQELLVAVLEGCGGCDDIPTLATWDLEADAWRQYFEEKGALADYDEKQVAVLVSYLAINFPNGATNASSLPRSTRSMVILNCQLCHSIAVPMTQARPLERWLEHRLIAPHDGLSLTPKDWETLAHYLANVAPLPLEVIPEQLRRGAGGY